MSGAPTARGFARLRLEVAASHLEWLMAELVGVGCLGAEICDEEERVVLDAYFPATACWPRAESVVAACEARIVEQGLLEDRDWLASYRRSAKPFYLGSRFVVDPREPGSPRDPGGASGSGRRLLLLPARRAFGVGSHETTRLAVELLESLVDEPIAAPARPLPEAEVLDLGCGTGVLALAARGLGANRVVALDADPTAAFAAAQNARLNELSLRVFAGSLAALDGAAAFDLVLCNVLPERLEGCEAPLVGAMRPGGALILSGVWIERSGAVLEGWRRRGLEPRREAREGDWVAWILTAER